MRPAGRAIAVQRLQRRQAQIGIHRADRPAASASTSLGPVTGNAATGVPQANASRITRPNVSVSAGNTNTSAPA